MQEKKFKSLITICTHGRMMCNTTKVLEALEWGFRHPWFRPHLCLISCLELRALIIGQFANVTDALVTKQTINRAYWVCTFQAAILSEPGWSGLSCTVNVKENAPVAGNWSGTSTGLKPAPFDTFQIKQNSRVNGKTKFTKCWRSYES